MSISRERDNRCHSPRHVEAHGPGTDTLSSRKTTSPHGTANLERHSVNKTHCLTEYGQAAAQIVSTDQIPRSDMQLGDPGRGKGKDQDLPAELDVNSIFTELVYFAVGVGNCRSRSLTTVGFGRNDPITLARADLMAALSVFFQPEWTSKTSSFVSIRP